MTHTKLAFSWFDALAIFKASEGHSSITSMLTLGRKLYTILLSKVPWLWVACVIGIVLGKGALFLHGAFLYVLFLAGRSSVACKDISYFIIKALFFLVPFALISIPFEYSFLGFNFLFLVLTMHCNAFLSLLFLFMLDAPFELKAYLKAVFYAMYFFLYNYPAVMLVEAFRLVFGLLTLSLLNTSVPFLGIEIEGIFLYVLLSLLYLPFYVSAMTTLYIRRVYEEGIYYA